MYFPQVANSSAFLTTSPETLPGSTNPRPRRDGVRTGSRQTPALENTSPWANTTGPPTQPPHTSARSSPTGMAVRPHDTPNSFPPLWTRQSFELDLFLRANASQLFAISHSLFRSPNRKLRLPPSPFRLSTRLEPRSTRSAIAPSDGRHSTQSLDPNFHRTFPPPAASVYTAR